MSNPFLDTSDTSGDPQGLTISDDALKRLAFLFAKESQNTVFRIQVVGGGCSGFQYTFDMDTHINKNDFIIPCDTFTVACDKQSLTYIDGGVIDFINALSGQYFTINNPNATANCGCGTSFSV